MSAANISALKAALAAKIAANTDLDALAIAEANQALDRYADALTAQSSLESGSIAAYSLAGRSITKRNLSEGHALLNRLKGEVYSYIRSDTVLIDQGGRV